MIYEETLDFLYSQLPQYQKIGDKAYKADLNNILAICYIIGEPQKKIKTIHVAGTNGKGSTSHILASVLQEAGYTVGLYTSPHLKDFRERIKIDGEKIAKQRVVDFVEKYKSFLEEIKPSFFEWTVALAFYEFAKQKVDIAVIETGLGGRLDSTNIIEPELSIITNIGMDHMSILGDTLEKIAFEKAGIIKENTPIVIGESQKEIQHVFIQKANELNAPLFFADQEEDVDVYATDLRGNYQSKNIQTVLMAIKQLKISDWKIKKKHIEKGLLKVISNTNFLGRWQIIQENPLVILDVAHNINGIEQALLNLKSYAFENLHLVIGMAKDKDREKIYKILPQQATYYFCSSENERLVEAIPLKYEAIIHNLRGESYENPLLALQSAKKNASENDLILAFGSNFIIADLV